MKTTHKLSMLLLSGCLLSSIGFCKEEGGRKRGGRTSPVAPGGMFSGSSGEFESVWGMVENQVNSWKGKPPQPLDPSAFGTGAAASGPMTADMHKKAMGDVRKLMQLGMGGPSGLRAEAGGASSELPEDKAAKSRVEDLTSGQVLHSTYMLQSVVKDMGDAEWFKALRRFKELHIKCMSEQDYIAILGYMRGVSDADWPTQKERIQAMYARRR